MDPLPLIQPHQTPSSPTDSPVDRIILVEDNKALRDSVAEYLTIVGYDVTAVESGLAFYHALAEQTFCVAVIDLGLPDINGLQLVEYIRNNTNMHCIILTARELVDDRIAGYDSGADLYMIKPVDCRELASALTRMVQRTTTPRDDSDCAGQWRLNRQNATLVTPSCAIIPLTAREMDFLLCLGAAPDETVPRADILAALGYSNDEFSNRALESLIRRLRRKIEGFFGSSPILTRHGVGYSFSVALILS